MARRPQRGLLRHPGGLRAQLLFGLILLVLIALALIAVATDQFHQRHLYQAAADDAHRQVQTLAALDDSPTRQTLFERLRAQEAIADAGPLGALALDADDVSSPLWIDAHNDASVIVATASTADGETIAIIRSLDDVEKAIADGRRALALFLLSTLLFITLVGYGFYSFIIIRPLRALGVATQRAADGDLASPIEILPANEFGDVGRQFNRMLQRLDDQRHELRRQLEATQQAHAELKDAQQSLIRSEKMASVGHLAAGIAHEVGNPLAAVMGYTDLIADPDLSPREVDDLVERSLTQLQRIRDIIRQLLDYSRHEAQRAPEPTDLAPLLDEALHLVGATGDGADTTMELHLHDDLSLAHAVPGELQQVLVNLLLNAVEAMADADTERPHLDLCALPVQGRIAIDVIDNGPGVDPDLADQIFDPFFTTRPPGEGTGLGLAIAHRLVDRVQGSLRLLDSQEGAHFRLLLHRADDPPS